MGDEEAVQHEDDLFAAVFGTDSEGEEDVFSVEDGVLDDAGDVYDCDGDSGDESDGAAEVFELSGCELTQPKVRVGHLWHSVDCVRGLWRCASFLNPAEQGSLVSAIEGEGWFSHASHNQVMRFGDLPAWAATLSCLILNSVSAFVDVIGAGDTQIGSEDAPRNQECRDLHSESGHKVPLPEDLLRREPLFDQMIVNSYQPGEGIGAHVDLARFEDGIAVLSLLSSCVMRFRKCEEPAMKVDVLLSPGDLILLSGDARYKWTHEINREEEQVWAGKVLKQERRVSVTLRRLCPHEHRHPE